MVWFYMLPYGLAALLYGPLARSFEIKNILLTCITIFSFSNLLAGLTDNIQVIFCSRALAGISGAAVIPLALIVIAKNSAAKERGTRVGRFFSFTFASSLLGVFLSGILDWRWIFIIPFIAGMLAAACVSLLPPLAAEKEKFQANYRQSLASREVLGLFIYIFIVSLIFHGIRQWLGVYFSLAGNLEQFFISMLLTTVSLSGIIGESVGGILADKLGRKKVVNLGISLMILAVFALLAKGSLVILFALMFIFGLGWTFNHVGVSTFLTDLPKRHLFESASLNSSVRFLAGGLGVMAGGVLMRTSFVLGFSVFGTCLLILWVMTNKLIVIKQEV